MRDRMKVLVCGSRSWNRQELILRRLKKLGPDDEIIHGDARGADQTAATIARCFGIPTRAYPADWVLHGNRAGIIRNLQMLDEQPDLVLAFWDGESRGTKHTIAEAEYRGIKVEIVYEQGGSDWR